MEIGERITEMRIGLGWSRARVAKLVGTNSRSVENWESGISMPSIENLLKLCQVFHTTPDTLLSYNVQSVLVLDDLPLDDQFTMRQIFQVLWDRNTRAK